MVAAFESKGQAGMKHRKSIANSSRQLQTVVVNARKWRLFKPEAKPERMTGQSTRDKSSGQMECKRSERYDANVGAEDPVSSLAEPE